MDIRLGSKVISGDGHDIGKVDRLVLNPETREIEEIVVHKGFFLTEDRIIPISSVTSTDQDGVVHVATHAADFASLPLFVEHAYRVPTADEYTTMPFPVDPVVGSPGYAGPILWSAPTQGRAIVTNLPMEAAPVAASSIGDDMVTIDRGTNVLDRDGETVGTVEDVLYDANGRLSGIVVTSGLIRKHELRVPAHYIEKLLDTEVWLNRQQSELDEE